MNKCICTDLLNHNPDQMVNPDCPIHGASASAELTVLHKPVFFTEKDGLQKTLNLSNIVWCRWGLSEKGVIGDAPESESCPPKHRRRVLIVHLQGEPFSWELSEADGDRLMKMMEA
jgi:hypothetical protein